jgi:hypothetical protein
MGSFRPLISIEVKHTYFARDLGPGLDFVPTPQTQVSVENSNLLVRNTQGGIRIFYDQANIEVLKLFANAPDDPFDLVYKAYAKDSWFNCYTELPAADDDSILYFDSRKAKPDEDDRLNLNAAEHVSYKDMVKFNAIPLEKIFSRRDRIVRPLFIVCFRLTKESIQALEQPSTPGIQNYYLSFKARETFWKYYLLGKMTKKKSFIVDPDNRIEFEDTGQTVLPGNRYALTFRSKNKIPLQEESDNRFELKEIGPNGGKPIIKRLPVATAQQFYKEIIDGNETIVSEIFINC